jgi:hypothetical protein
MRDERFALRGPPEAERVKREDRRIEDGGEEEIKK